MNTVDESVKYPPDSHMNGHVAAHAEAEAVVTLPPDPGSTTAQRPSSEQIAKTVDELARLSPLEFAVVKKERAAELGLTLLDLTRAVNERRKALKAKAAIEDDDDTRESQADTLVRYACDASQFYSNPNNEDETYALVKMNGHRECWTLKSTGFKAWLRFQYYSRTGRSPKSDAFNQALDTIDAKARFEGASAPIFLRRAEHRGKIYIDLCDEAWRAIEMALSELYVGFCRNWGASWAFLFEMRAPDGASQISAAAR